MTGTEASVTIHTSCDHCGEPMRIETDGHSRARAFPEAARPVVFLPMIDPERWRAPNILDGF